MVAWKALRRQVEARHHTRRAQARFPRDPATYYVCMIRLMLRRLTRR
jgi:hypothetical protein